MGDEPEATPLAVSCPEVSFVPVPLWFPLLHKLWAAKSACLGWKTQLASSMKCVGSHEVSGVPSHSRAGGGSHGHNLGALADLIGVGWGK